MKLKFDEEMSKSRSLDRRSLQKESSDRLQEGTKLHELGEKFESDKEKLEDEIDKVRNSKLSEADKKKLIAQLDAAVQELQEQYDREVTAEEDKVQQEFMSQIESMQEAADALAQEAEELRGVKLEAASMDTSAAADEADAQKQAFEQMKMEYVEKLKLQMEQAEVQQRNIRSRRLGGR